MNLAENQKYAFELPELPEGLLEALSQATSDQGIKRVAFVGGIVRDGLLQKIDGKKQPKPIDIDLIVEGSAEKLASSLQSKLGSERVSEVLIYKSYQTVGILLDQVPIDIASSRKETYKNPGENPTVSSVALEQDLERRDFIINAMAVDVASGTLLDPHQGEEALKNRELAFLHSRSITDDPTRLIRAARYAARLK